MYRRSLASLVIMVGACLPALADQTTAVPAAAVVQASPTDGVVVQVETLEAAGSVEQARALLQQAMTTYPQSADLKVRLGRSYQKSGNMAEARAAYQSVLDSEPTNAGALGALGMMLAKGGNADQAVLYLRRAVAAPGAETRVQLALAKLIDSNLATAAEADALYVDILKREPTNTDVRLKRAQLANFRGDNVGYCAQLQLLVTDTPTCVASIVSVAQLLANEDETRPRATSLLRPVFELTPADGTVAQELMNNLVADKQYAEVAMLSERWAKADPKNSMPWHYLCTALGEQKKLPEATAAMQTAIDLAPDEAKGYVRLAKLQLRQNNWPGAEAAFRSAITKSTGNADPVLDYADALAENKRPADALLQYREALKVEAGSASVYLRLGKALSKAGQKAEARQVLQAGLKVEPDDTKLLDALKSLK